MSFSVEFASDQMRAIKWFANVGAEDAIQGANLKLDHVSSWKHAIEGRGSNSTSNSFLEASGMLTRTLSSNFRSDYQKWNLIAGSVREAMKEQILPSVDAMVDRIPGVASEESGPEFIKSSIRWDLMHFAMEQAYSELVQPKFYTELFDVYQAGHFPCDWDERWPNGRLWVF